MQILNTQKKVSALERGRPNHAQSLYPVLDYQALETLERTLQASRFFQKQEQEAQPVSIHHQRTAYVRVEEGNDRNPFTFTGLLLPFEWQEKDERSGKMMSRLRNRTLIIGNKSYPWFEPFCRELLEDGTSMRIRVRVNALHGDRLAFIIPAARTEEHAKAEWTVSQALLKKDLPARFYHHTPSQLARTVYERFVKIHGGSVTHYDDEGCRAVAVDRTGKIFLLSNGEFIEEHCGSLKLHDVILDRDISLCVRTKQLSSLAELTKITDHALSLDKLLNPY